MSPALGRPAREGAARHKRRNNRPRNLARRASCFVVEPSGYPPVFWMFPVVIGLLRPRVGQAANASNSSPEDLARASLFRRGRSRRPSPSSTFFLRYRKFALGFEPTPFLPCRSLAPRLGRKGMNRQKGKLFALAMGVAGVITLAIGAPSWREL